MPRWWPTTDCDHHVQFHARLVLADGLQADAQQFRVGQAEHWSWQQSEELRFRRTTSESRCCCLTNSSASSWCRARARGTTISWASVTTPTWSTSCIWPIPRSFTTKFTDHRISWTFRPSKKVTASEQIVTIRSLNIFWSLSPHIHTVGEREELCESQRVPLHYHCVLLSQHFFFSLDSFPFYCICKNDGIQWRKHFITIRNTLVLVYSHRYSSRKISIWYRFLYERWRVFFLLEPEPLSVKRLVGNEGIFLVNFHSSCHCLSLG